MKGLLLRLRPADALNVFSLLLLTAVTVIFYREISRPGMLVFLYSSLILTQVLLILFRDRGRFVSMFHDLIFPTISIVAIFDSLEGIVHSINPVDIDPLLIRLDYILFGGYPTVMMEKIMNPLLTDLLQAAYSSYYFFPVILGIVLKVKKEDAAFDRSLFLIMLCFYLSYLGYILMPALGPRFTINHLQETDLQGWLIAEPVQNFLNRLEGVKRDAFPSGHTGIALTVLYLAFRFEKRLFLLFLPFVATLIFSTVYCRYHYVVDVIAGVLLTLLTVFAGESLYRNWRRRAGAERPTGDFVDNRGG